MLPAALNVFSQIGWLIINSIVGGQVLAAVSTHLNDTAGIVIIVIISFVVSYRLICSISGVIISTKSSCDTALFLWVQSPSLVRDLHLGS